MQRALRIGLITVSAFMVPCAAFAATGDDVFVLKGDGQKFYALPSDNTPASIPRELKSDRKEMQKGFIALDRQRDKTPHRATSVGSQVNTVRSTQADRDVLTLFEGELGTRLPPVAASASKGGVNHAWPLPASVRQKISSGYGMRSDPFHGQQRFHGGVDIAAPAGTPILASADGYVKETGYRAGLGNYVTLTHADGSESMYNHLQKAEARRGSFVRTGQTIGRLGSTGRSTGPHLDYRLSKGGQRIDPMTALAGKQPTGVNAVASRARAPMTIVQKGTTAVREQRGVRIISPQQRVAMSGGFIKVR